ncbi:hypothetical protein MJO28_007525 [Puccinia striiformis f. sp. tritici]|uniref:Uncharacterized protein n=3 Tax=Puccinia striiformis TaxID=27350 RepID=A0A0L0VSC7_9BASI|nr:hypothetical protein Pst134EA_013628 [Puccinia striiformis f. sp. tritici]KAI9604018.1 hypothetical protein H4Q26_003628 [Puccinia striiformis f. sp. tritici PST-130]KNF02166.1 hypothetical protein PSTG_04663 [Puccinia striiformis f. sp. tritici PST-78]POW22816.1 hypothetical protein PSHT_00875 [Puccinia striiformis]KAH9454533.1 hypothetical protein Pst134EB_014606 [Puccinia striiformis f. sp. tritici]KAH9465761.1 hypothetical protein Pst134EA_013628 [Puccinia striiformis f. sp. tritici]
MEENGPPKKVVAEMVQSFRSSHPEEKSEGDYEEIFRSAFSHLRGRANAHLDQKGLIKGSTEEAPRPAAVRFFADKLRLFMVYMLKLQLKPFVTTKNPFEFPKNDQKSGYEEILSNLVDFEATLDHFLDYMAIMSASHMTSQPIPDPELFSTRLNISGAQETEEHTAPASAEHVEDCLTLRLLTFFAAWVELFDNFSFSPLNARSVSKHWDNIVKETNLVIDQVDISCRHIQLAALDIAKADWQEMIDKIEDSLVLLSNPIVANVNEDFEPDSDDEAGVGGEIMIKFAEAAIPFIKLCRIYIKKLRQSIVSQPLIFDPPSITMEDDRLESLLNCLGRSEISNSLEELTGILEWELPSRRDLEVVIVKPLRGFNRCSKIWNTYLDLLLESDNPLIERGSIIDTREWLNSWTKSFFIAARKAMDVTGRGEHAWPSDIEIEDTSGSDSLN